MQFQWSGLKLLSWRIWLDYSRLSSMRRSEKLKVDVRRENLQKISRRSVLWHVGSSRVELYTKYSYLISLNTID